MKMEPNKMEKDFKEKLEQRTIQPSEMAWDRLDAMLSVAENKKPKRNRTWMYMAAAFLVFLLVGALFLNQEKENSGLDNNNSVVTTEEQPQNDTEAENSETIIAPVTNEQAVAVQGTSSGIQHKQAGTLNKSVKATQNESVKNVSVVNQESIAANDKKEPANTIQVNNAEKLLASATPAETSKKKTTVKVDPNSLLSSVEEELDDSFKDKVLIGTVKSFNTVKSAVANRNYQ
jgi:hypothetical protein